MKSFRKKWMLLALLSMSISLYASHVSVEQARLVADGFLQSETALHNGPRKAPQKTRKTPRTLLSDQQFYVFDIDGGGFVIIAADDCAHPVLAYGEKGLSPENTGNGITMPDNLRNWLEGYNYSIRAAIADGYKAPASVQEEWNALAEGKYTVAEPVVEPLIKTKWNQNQEYINVDNTYNYYTPADVYVYEGQEYPMNTPVGCVATAMAQVMKYWEWPKKGTGSHSYLPKTNPKYGVQSANFGATTYDWANMPDSLTYDMSTDRQIQAVAKLMYHCGVACDMDYDIEGSSAYSVVYGKYAGYSPAEHALCTYFGYSNTLESYQRWDFEKDSDWIQMLKDELDAARPILYAGRGEEEGGHSFVCCGYDTEDRFYFNFGWGGSYDGYFSIDAITPGGSGTGGNSEHNYSFGQDAIVGIRPAESDSERAYDMALRLYHDDNYDYSPKMTLDSLWYYGDTLTVNLYIANYDSVDYNGALALQVLDDAGRVVATSQTVTRQIVSFNYDYVTLQLLPSLGLVPGHYHVQPVFRNSAGAWTSIEAKHYWSDLEFTVYHWSNIFAYSEMTVSPEPLVQNKRARISVDIANVTGKALDGMFYVSLYDLDGTWLQDLGEIDLSSSPLNDYTYMDCSFTDSTVQVAPGEYVLIPTYWDGSNLYIVGSDMYNVVRRVTVVSEEDAPVPEDYYLTAQSLIPFGYINNEIHRTIYEGDSIYAYVQIANEGKTDYDGYILVELLDNDMNDAGYSIYKSVISGRASTELYCALDTTLNAGTYYAVVYYWNETTSKWTAVNGGEADYWCSFVVYKQEPTGLSDVSTNVRVYPNPIVDVLYVDGAEVGQYSLYNLSGQMLMNRKENGAQQIPMSGVPAGEYILQLVDTQGKISVHRVTKR